MNIIQRSEFPAFSRKFEGEVPVLRISRAVMTRQAKRFLTNSDPQVIRAFYLAGIKCFDVASPVEMATVRSIAPDAILHYHNPVRSRDEIAQAIHSFGCKRFAVDHMDEFEKLDSYVPNPRMVEIAVRFRIKNHQAAVQNFSSKFGTTITKSQAIMKAASRRGYRVGLTFHPGSQTVDTRPYAEQIQRAARIARTAKCKLAFLNTGGGFPAAYANLVIPPLEAFFKVIEQAARDAFSGTHQPRLECEPGRALVAPAGQLETHIKAVRRENQEIFLNDGIYGGLAETAQFPAMFPQYGMPVRLSSSPKEPMMEWTAFGPTCDPADMLPRKLLLPHDIVEGERVVFRGMGAYSTATTTRFNGYGNIKTVLVD